jgi:hypothetical protein
MNYIGLIIEIKKMIKSDDSKNTIRCFANSKWESQPFGFSKRIDSMQNLIIKIRKLADKYKTKKAFYKNLSNLLDNFK